MLLRHSNHVLNLHRIRYGFQSPHQVALGIRHESLEAGEGKSGHIKTDSDEGIIFFGSTWGVSHLIESRSDDDQISFHCVSNGYSDYHGKPKIPLARS